MSTAKKNILKIGVTGGIGSGKSAVCSCFARFGVPVLYADDIAKNLSTANSSIRKKLSALLGESTYLSDGTLNRSVIAAKIFSSRDLQKKVESIIHPHVEIELDRQMEEFARRGERMVIVEAALIYEAGLHKKLDAVVVVAADEHARLSRVVQRDAIPEEHIRRRMDAQLDVKKKAEKADFVIYNNGSLEELESKVRFLYSVFMQLNEGKKNV